MGNVDYKLSDAVDEFLTASPLPAYLNGELVRLLEEQWDSNVQLVTDSDDEMREHIYGNPEKILYAVTALSYQDEPYMYMVIPWFSFEVRQVFNKLIRFYIDGGRYSSQVEMGEMIKTISKVKSNLNVLVSEGILRSKRVNKNSDENPTFNLPSDEELQVFYECGRKVKYGSEQEAEEHLSENEHKLKPYLCVRCEKWHNGKPPTGEIIPKEVMVGRWRTTWKRSQMEKA